ncbi:hypothetical protein L2E82_17254 [Cichorium intybus]|uniref:Uncharacterized protein n=1 Tax=Cichorium intybus TaxID=13427 RepID=A0ACB9F7S6_CICIN|nr:hypothetical protein L2E82_17254 [Cichorium intybus]
MKSLLLFSSDNGKTDKNYCCPTNLGLRKHVEKKKEKIGSVGLPVENDDDSPTNEFTGKNLLDVGVDLDSHLLGQIPAVSVETSDGNADVVVDLEDAARGGLSVASDWRRRSQV